MLKTELREQYLLKRSTLRKEITDQLNEEICGRVFELIEQKNIRLLHTFLPRQGAKEIDTAQIIGLFWDKKPEVTLAAPRVIPGTSEMEHFILNAETTLVTSPWKIPEPDPKTSQSVNSQEIDAVLIPLLAFDQHGFRVGYGGGFYDRFLPTCKKNVIKIGLSFFEAEEQITDLDTFDIPLDFCVTPSKTYIFTE